MQDLQVRCALAIMSVRPSVRLLHSWTACAKIAEHIIDFFTT